MGGKRTKNNTKPSSSGRSAEMLGSMTPTLFGFTTLDSSNMPVVPSFVQIEAHGEDIDPNLDDTFQIVLKKMLKKDPTTKTKALQEFTELIGKSDLDVVKAVLPFWPRLYSNLSTDVEHRVRETAQQAQAAVVAKAGKHIAPFLKQLAPTWISAQYDTYAPAASLASKSFTSAFPPGKLREVFVFCEDEILDYYTKNLTVHTAITLSNPKSHTPEECENKYQRVLIASLQGYALYLSKLPKEQLQKSVAKNTTLLDNVKFWTYHKHKTPAVRSAWFEVVTALLQHGPFLLEQHHQKVVSCVFQFMDETDPVVVAHVWSSIVLIQTTISDWHTHLNIDKAVFPKLWKVLKSGASGNAACVFPHMLPLVSKFTREILDERMDKFQTLFFENIKEGLMAVHSSRADISAISQAYYEVFQYVVIQMIKDTQLQPEEIQQFCEKMLEEHLINVIEWCMTTESSRGRFVFGNIATLLDYWCKQSANIKIYGELLAKFWCRLYEVIEQSVRSAEDLQETTSAHIELIQNLKRTSHKRVKFNNDSVERPTNQAANDALHFEDQLNALVYKICRLYIERIGTCRESAYILQLENLIGQFQSAQMFQFFAGGESAKIECLFDVFAGDWLNDERLQSEYVVEIVLILYKYLDELEQVALLNRWIKLANKTVRKWLILRALSHPLCNDRNITKFLTQTEVSEYLISCAHAVTQGDTRENIILLHKCFLVSTSGDVLIDPGTCRRIVQMLATPLKNDDEIELKDTCASFLAQIMPVICGDSRQQDLQRIMFVILFEFSAENSVSDYLSEDTLWEVTTAWQDALSDEDLTLDSELVDKCTEIIEKEIKMFTEKDDFHLEHFEKLTKICTKLMTCGSESLKRDKANRSEQIAALFETITKQNANENSLAKNLLGKLSTHIELLNAVLATKSDDHGTDLLVDAFTKNMRVLFVRELFCTNVVYQLSCSSKNAAVKNCENAMDHDGNEDDDNMNVEGNFILHWTELIYEKVLSVIYTNAIGTTLLYSSNDLDDTVEVLIISLQEKISLLMKGLPANVLEKLKERLFELANQTGLLWAKSLLSLLETKQYSDPESGAVLLYEDVSTVVNSEDLMSYINILQILSRSMPPKCLPIRPNLFENYFDILVKLAATRCLIVNHFSSNFNEIGDKKIVGNALIVLNEMISKQNNTKCLHYNCDLMQVDGTDLYLDIELANLLTDVVCQFPTELDLSKWDFVRIALSSWTLTVSKNHQHFRTNDIAIFIAAIFRLFSTVIRFFEAEKTKSSTEMLTNVIEEWDNVFAKDVNLVLLKTFVNIVNNIDCRRIADAFFLDAISTHVNSIDLGYVLKTKKVDSKISLDDLITFALTNLSHSSSRVRVSCAAIIQKLTVGLIQTDLEQLHRRNESVEQQRSGSEEVDDSWHLLQRFKTKLDEFQPVLGELIADFNYKITETDDNTPVQQSLGRDRLLAYQLLWDCILGICAKSPPELRSIYASWITRNFYEQTLLPTLFRLMPHEILKNPDSGAIYGQTMFSSLEWSQIKNTTLKPERYACHLYTQCLRFLPAVVRRWWNGLNHRHAAIVGKVTSNCVSNLLCQEEFQSLTEKRDLQDNMQIKVLAAARQVIAIYAIEDARVELHITLPNNFPLGAVNVEDGKQIGGRLQSRQIVMQLSIFLTHQNGSLWDGLSLWKRNLDRKFEGIEECYVCYSVLHQETCQLPKLSCKTCKKKFHGPCLYRWFSTSSKSTCPICRNIF
ncbi:E3 ubiquitin-protein ligase listerin [Toxorhynchites rutilus septentrionalis]|uniref:E3 ubiquitin-protein ligase listerin n=1 Tax=Toxorhynchites rutilus septentrionalis TaxID=329112 RepID=UPI0024785F16|nr:E3 ubiquitin-protein ligase listerin [Toxorhynchites rutilus septentrionalis]